MIKETKVESEFFENPGLTSFKCADAIEISLFIEKEGLAFYEKAAKNVFEHKIKAMFLRLAEEEREHIQILQTKIQFLRPTIYAKAAKSETLVSFIREQLEDKIFPTFDKNFAKEFKNDLDVLEYGIECEKRSIQVLNNLLAEEKKLDVKSIFAHLVVEEKKHLSLLEELKAKI